MDLALCLKGVSKTYAGGVHALQRIDLQIPRGDFFALLGPNGAGKTTIIGAVTGLVKKTQGSIEIFGHDIDQAPSAAKRKVGVVPQEFNFNIFEKVIDIVITQGGYFGLPHKEAKQRAEALLKDLGLWEKRNMPSRTLSGGMKRRLMIARALVHDPELLILDEPTAGVDVELRHGMWEYLRRINAEGKTILLTTHYLEEAEKLSQHLAIIQKGKIIQQGKVRDLLRGMKKKTYIFQFRDGEEEEVVLQSETSLAEAFKAFEKKGKDIVDVHPKMNPLEELFLDLLKENK